MNVGPIVTVVRTLAPDVEYRLRTRKFANSGIAMNPIQKSLCHPNLEDYSGTGNLYHFKYLKN